MTLSPTFKVPGIFITVDNSLANTASAATYKAVIVGQKTAAGTVTAETLTRVFGKADATIYAGVGSMLDEMCTTWFDNNPLTEVYIIALDDAAASVAETIDWYTSGSVTKGGTFTVSINGKNFSVGAAVGDSGQDIDTAMTALLQSVPTIPGVITYTPGPANDITFTAKNKGTLGNSIDIRVNENDADFPLGLTMTGPSPANSGATDPDVDDAIAALPDQVFQIIVNPYTDATNLGKWKIELDRRWGQLVQLDGTVIGGFEGTPGELVTKGDALNDAYLSLIDSGLDTRTPAYLKGAMYAGQIAGGAEVDPALPFKTLPLIGADGDSDTDQRTLSEQNAIINSGLSLHEVGTDGTVRILRAVTTYKTNAVGSPDNSYLNLNTITNLSFLRQSYKIRMETLYAQSKLAEDGWTGKSGQVVATPLSIKGATIDWYSEQVFAGLAQDVDAFAEALTVEIDGVVKSRTNNVLQFKIMGQYYQQDATMQFLT